jgi:hypothetical protein
MKSDRLLKQLIWLYLILVIFEGVLRKWVLPGLATPLLVVRDPIVILGLFLGFQKGKIKFNGYLAVVTVVAVMAPVLAMTAGHGNLMVTAFGWRANFLHLPFIFLIGQTLSREDVETMGRFLMWVSLLIALIMLQQFYSPPGSWINIGVGGEGDSGFDGALGYKRPSATFSFIVGPVMFFPFVAAFVFHQMLQPRTRGKWLAMLSGLAVLMAMPTSISRGLVVGVVIVGIGTVVALATSGRSVQRLIYLGAMSVIMMTALSFIPGLEKPREAFLSRWDASTTQRGGIEEAILKRMTDSMTLSMVPGEDQMLTGVGLGMGTNAGARLATGGKVVFLVAEDEWSRITGELGLPLGLLYLGVRVILTISLFFGALKVAKSGRPLALILWFSAGIHLAQGQWGQPTALGFSVIQAGLVLALIESHRREKHVLKKARLMQSHRGELPARVLTPITYRSNHA